MTVVSASGQEKPTSSGATAAKTQSTDNNYDPLLDSPPLPRGSTTLVGGTVHSIDQIRDRLTLQPFGGSPMKVFFDERTHIYRDGTPTTQMGIHKGDRVYVDTMLDGTRVFARNIRVVTGALAADARGQVLVNDLRRRMITVQDELSAQPVTFRVTPATVVDTGSGKTTVAQLLTGSLVQVKFSADRRSDVAQEISVLAAPGSAATFYGKITYLNLSTRMIAVANESDKKTYDIRFTPAAVDVNSLQQGAQVLVKATFNGQGYTASNIEFMKPKSQ